MARPDDADLVDDADALGVARADRRPDAFGKWAVNADIAVMRVIVHVLRLHDVSFDMRTIGMGHHPLGSRNSQRACLLANFRNQFVGRQSPIAGQQRAGRRHVARIFNIVLFKNIGGLAQLFLESQIDGVADDTIGRLHRAGDDRRHAPSLARIGALAPIAPSADREYRTRPPSHRRRAGRSPSAARKSLPSRRC